MYQQIYPVFHISLLEPCHLQEEEVHKPPTIPITDDEEL